MYGFENCSWFALKESLGEPPYFERYHTICIQHQLILLNQQLLESFNLAATNRSNFITFKFALSFLANRAGLNSDFTIHSVLIRPVRN